METNPSPDKPANQTKPQTEPSLNPNGAGPTQPIPNSSPAPDTTAGAQASAPPPTDKTCWQSEDGLVTIKQLVKLAQRHPPSDYPCVVVQSVPRRFERIRQLNNDVMELMLTYEDVEQFVTELNAAAATQGKGKLYEILQHVPPKSKSRKERWRRFNRRRIWTRQQSRRAA